MPDKTYRLVTRDWTGRSDQFRYTVHFEGTKAQCRRYAVGRWGGVPGFAVITTRSSNFERAF